LAGRWTRPWIYLRRELSEHALDVRVELELLRARESVELTRAVASLEEPLRATALAARSLAHRSSSSPSQDSSATVAAARAMACSALALVQNIAGHVVR
jgi:hypothetical protein